MDSLGFMTDIVYKQRHQDLVQEVKTERFLDEKKNRDAITWVQRRLRRNRKSK